MQLEAVLANDAIQQGSFAMLEMTYLINITATLVLEFEPCKKLADTIIKFKVSVANISR